MARSRGFDYTTFKHKPENETDENYDYVKLPYEDNIKNGKKVLFVLDYVPSEDLHSGRLLSGATGDLLGSMIFHAKKLYAKDAEDFNWLACTYNAYRTVGKSSEYVAHAREDFDRRLAKLITKYKPDVIIPFGRHAIEACIPEKIKLSNDKVHHWLGVPVKAKFKFGEATHRATVFSNISLNTIINGKGDSSAIVGYMMRCMANAMTGHKYLVDSAALEKHKSIVIDTYDKFERMMTRIEKAPVVSIDTETKNLYRITNKLLTLQFATDADTGYLLPFYHKDTPFSPKELARMKKRLKEYFEGANENDYHIFANAQFDLSVLKTDLGIEFYATDIWDIFGGEFALDENLKSLETSIGGYYYSLLNLSIQYGFEGYLTAEFGKSNRGSFENTDLSDRGVIRYTTMDVVVPFAIHLKQKQRAIDMGYAAYERVVRYEISDTIHSFSVMEHTGSKLDTPYLFFLRSNGSPIQQVIKSMTAELLSTAAAKKADRLIRKNEGIPTPTLFNDAQKLLEKRQAGEQKLLGVSGSGGAPSASSFARAGGGGGNINLWRDDQLTALKLNKPDHKKIFFFKCLNLKPLSVGKDGSGKIDKAFQKHYSDVKEVGMYTALEQAKKLANAYVKSFIKMLGESLDLQKDGRIRPRYHYLKVVTHRGSASDPNLQQVPQHSPLAKHIKRLFVARPGYLYIKVDYKAHEVRGWGLISSDHAVAGLFLRAKALFDEYRLRPDPVLLKRLDTEGDIHRINAEFFFSVDINNVDKALRNAVKAIVFGLIYGKSAKTLSADINQSQEFTDDLITRFSNRFKAGMKWLADNPKLAEKQFYVESPTGLRRNLWAYILPESMQEARTQRGRANRQSVNSPIQGMCSKFMMNGVRYLDRVKFNLAKKIGRKVELFINNSVHDSLENEASYRDFILSLKLIEDALTNGVRKTVKARHNFDFLVDVEIDFEIGATLSYCEAWKFDVHSLERLVLDNLLVQRNELKHEVDVQAAHDLVFSRATTEDAPRWMRQQIKNIGYKFDLTERKYIKEILQEGTELKDKAEAMMEAAEKIKDEAEKKAAQKKASDTMKAATAKLAYAEKLEGFRTKLKR